MIYALCDYQTLQKFDKTLSEFIQICNNLHVALIQYRDKINNIDIQKQNILFLKQNTKIPIIINDNLDLFLFLKFHH